MGGAVPSANPQLSASLAEGIAALGLALSTAQQRRLIEYVLLLEKWNGVYNLTAVRDVQEMLTMHLLDSLTLVPHLAKLGVQSLLDVGSGGGLPGIPVAIARPDLPVTMVDTVQKKVAFLTQARGVLGLANARALHARVESLALEILPDAIVSRAFAELADMANLAGHLLAPGGWLLAMKGVTPDAEIARLPANWAVKDIHPLHVPGLNAQRCLVLMQRCHE